MKKPEPENKHLSADYLQKSAINSIVIHHKLNYSDIVNFALGKDIKPDNLSYIQANTVIQELKKRLCDRVSVS